MNFKELLAALKKKERRLLGVTERLGAKNSTSRPLLHCSCDLRLSYTRRVKRRWDADVETNS